MRSFPYISKSPIIRHITTLRTSSSNINLNVRVLLAIALIVLSKSLMIYSPFFYKNIIEKVSTSNFSAVPIILIIAYAGAQFLSQLTSALRKILFLPVTQRMIRIMSLSVFRHMHALPLRFHLDRKTGGVVHIVQRGIASVEHIFDIAIFTIIPTFIEMIVIAFILWHLYSLLISLVVISTALFYLIATITATRLHMTHRREMNRLDIDASVAATDSLLNYETVKYFGAEVHEAHRYDRARQAHEKAALASGLSEALVTTSQALVIGIGLTLVMLLAARGIARGEMTAGDFVLVVSYLIQLYVPLGILGAVYFGAKMSFADLAAMNRLLDRDIEIVDGPDATALAATRGDVRFDHVSFGYDSRRDTLTDITFDIPAGTTVALVGPSGAGKSSIARLLFRFYDVTTGSITIDGQDIRAVTQASLRRIIGVVPQDTVLFNDTIAQNIAYGRPGATRQEIEDAARFAHLHAIICDMPDGYDTKVGERGLKLSGGEKQRVAIARVILKDPMLLILDEATSALDGQTEKEIQQRLAEVSANRSTLIIAHRLSTVAHAHMILVLDKGRIVERGRHEALLARNSLYAAMWRRQRRADQHGQPDPLTLDSSHPD